MKSSCSGGRSVRGLGGGVVEREEDVAAHCLARITSRESARTQAASPAGMT